MVQKKDDSEQDIETHSERAYIWTPTSATSTDLSKPAIRGRSSDY
jgi:hypothetical protein